MAESLRGGAGSGVRVAVAPLLTDAPIVALSWGLAGSLNPESPWLAVLSLVAHCWSVIWQSVNYARACPRRARPRSAAR
jgi:hypothetical protein